MRIIRRVPMLFLPRWHAALVAAVCGVSLLMGAWVPAARAQTPGSLDLGFDPGAGADAGVHAVAVQSDGKIVIGGDFKSFNGVKRKRIARLNADGSVDPTFDPGSGADQPVASVALQGDGKIVIGGSFTMFNGVTANHLARLNVDGSLDAAFNVAGAGANDFVIYVTVQADGKIALGGGFTAFNGTPANHVARLNADGSVDATFQSGLPADVSVYSLAEQGDGSIVLGGDFAPPNSSGNTLERLNADGSLDTTFPDLGGDFPFISFTSVAALAVQGDDKIVYDGSNESLFEIIGSSPYVNRLNADGSPDASFTAPNLVTDTVGDSHLSTLALQSNGGILIGGSLSTSGLANDSLKRLHADGTLDASFRNGPGLVSGVNAIALQGDGNIVIGGSFTTVDGAPRNRVARLFGGRAAPGTVNLTVNGNGEVVKDGANGIVLATRDGGDTSEPLNVFYKVKGTAMAGVDYKKLPGMVTIPAGATKAKIKIKPIAGAPDADGRKVKLVLLPPADGSYLVGTSPAKIKLPGGSR